MKYIKYIPWILVILALTTVSVYQYKAASAARELVAVRNTELMKSNLELGRANTKIVNQANLHKTAIEKIEKKWKDEVKKRQALITLYAELEAKYEAEKKKVKIKTKIIYKDKPGEIVDLPKGKLYLRQDDGTYKEITSLQWSYKDFRLHINGDALRDQAISYKLTQRFKGKLVESTLPNGARNHYFELYEIDDKGKKVGKIKLEKFEVLKANELTEKMDWWNPKLDIHIAAGLTQDANFTYLADLGLSISSYGSTADDIKWRFFRVGAGVSRSGLSLTFAPALYNIGKNLPLVNNIYIVPSIGYDFSKSYFFSLGISVVM